MRWDSEKRAAGWFGPPERPRFGWVHRPAGEAARALVVICPSLGQEAVFSHYTLRSLADELCRLGFTVVRFDYDGTGDSAGAADDPDRVGAWLDSVADAVALGRRHTSAPLVLLGFRLGALLAVEAAARHDLAADGMILWDAPRSGRQFLRELVIRQNVSVGQADFGSGAFTALGLTLTEDARAQLSGLRRHRTLPAGRVLAIQRGDSADSAVSVATTVYGSRVERLEAVDQDELLSRQAVPWQTRQRIVDWCARTYPDARHPMLPPVELADTPLERDGVRDRVTAVGPHGLFGVTSEPAAQPTSTTTVVFVPDSITPHGGLSRIWTELARQWAAAGVRSLRFDLSGCADSASRDGQPEHTVGVLAHLDDAVDALRHAAPDDPTDTIVVGLCSGAYLSVEAALTVRPRGMVLVNPVMSFITPEEPADPRRRAIVLTRRVLHRLFGRAAGRLAARLAEGHQVPAFTNDSNFSWHRAFEACFWQVYLHDKASWLPDAVWRVLNRLLTNTAGLDRTLAEVRSGGTEVLMVAGEPDFPRSTIGARRRLRALARHGGLTVTYQTGLDHAMMRPGTKDDVAASITRFVSDVARPVPAQPPVRELPTRFDPADMTGRFVPLRSARASEAS